MINPIGGEVPTHETSLVNNFQDYRQRYILLIQIRINCFHISSPINPLKYYCVQLLKEDFFNNATK